MTFSNVICPKTKRELPIDVDMPTLHSAPTAFDNVVGYTLTLNKCPDCGDTHAWESPDVDHLHGTPSRVWTIVTSSHNALHRASRHA